MRRLSGVVSFVNTKTVQGTDSVTTQLLTGILAQFLLSGRMYQIAGLRDDQSARCACVDSGSLHHRQTQQAKSAGVK